MAPEKKKAPITLHTEIKARWINNPKSPENIYPWFKNKNWWSNKSHSFNCQIWWDK